MKVERLGAKHYDEIINLLNAVFSRKNGREMDFEKDMPKMCVRDEEHMSKHMGIFEDGKLVACMGVYPFDTIVAGKSLKFATTGNIAVHWDNEGKGYMGAMVEFAMQELERLDVDVARLGGLRSRYNRYGFEACGQNYTFTFTSKNRERKFPDFKNDVIFKVVTSDDKDILAFCASVYNKNAISVPRNEENVYSCLTMWRNTPYVALNNDSPIGYLSVNAAGNEIAELCAVDTAAFADVLCGWQARVGVNLTFDLQMHFINEIKLFSSVCEWSSIHSTSHFKIRNWASVLDAFMNLKASYSEMMPGDLYIEIEDYGTVHLFSDGKNAGCKLTDHKPDIKLSRLEATRYIFGPYPPIYTSCAPAVAQAWFPLPLSWNGQDRV